MGLLGASANAVTPETAGHVMPPELFSPSASAKRRAFTPGRGASPSKRCRPGKKTGWIIFLELLVDGNAISAPRLLNFSVDMSGLFVYRGALFSTLGLGILALTTQMA